MAALTSLARSIGEPSAFDAFYIEHAERLLRFFARRTLDGEAAADLTAETFAQAYRSRRRFRGRGDEEAAGWLYAIAYRQLASFRHRGLVDRVMRERLGIATPQLVDADYERIEQLADLPALRDELARVLDLLSPGAQVALRLRVVDELAYGEIATRLDVTEQAARARVSRALRDMAHLFNQEVLT